LASALAVEARILRTPALATATAATVVAALPGLAIRVATRSVGLAQGTVGGTSQVEAVAAVAAAAVVSAFLAFAQWLTDTSSRDTLVLRADTPSVAWTTGATASVIAALFAITRRQAAGPIETDLRRNARTIAAGLAVLTNPGVAVVVPAPGLVDAVPSGADEVLIALPALAPAAVVAALLALTRRGAALPVEAHLAITATSDAALFVFARTGVTNATTVLPALPTRFPRATTGSALLPLALRAAGC